MTMKISAKPFGYPSQNKKRSNATHKANASCFTFYLAPPAPSPRKLALVCIRHKDNSVPNKGSFPKPPKSPNHQ